MSPSKTPKPTTTFDKNSYILDFDGLMQSVKTRPYMYIGCAGFNGFACMLGYLLDELLADTGSEAIFQFELDQDDNVSIRITAISVQKTYERLQSPETIANTSALPLGVLIGMSDQLTIAIVCDGRERLLKSVKAVCKFSAMQASDKPDGITITFHADPEIFKAFDIDYFHLNNILKRYAYLNPDIKIISIANQQEYQRNVFAFKKGVAEQLDTMTWDSPYARLIERLDLKITIGNYAYQISLADNWSGFIKSTIRSYADNQETHLHGSLIDGILLGIMDAVKREAVTRDVKIRISKKRITDHLIIIAAVQGPDIYFSGSTKSGLYMPNIKKDIRPYITEQWSAYFKAKPDQARRWIHQLEVDQPE